MGDEIDVGEEKEAGTPGTIPLTYEPNPKHKPLPQPGRRGSICPPEADGPGLLKISDLDKGKRYATDGTHAYCAQLHREEMNLWHGYPINWDEVPPKLRTKWVSDNLASARTVRRAMKRRD